jgi:AraC-like DNA-binding protein
MLQNEPYLNPELSLKQLAIELKTPERLLSGVINQYSNQNFYDFTNNFRIEKAKKLLAEDTLNRNTIQEIFYDSGFNSKSTFNLAFKKATGITPTEFKKMQKQGVGVPENSN